jgi:amidohydrolase
LTFESSLPLEEKNDIPYKSQINGIMHACGHDGHTAMLIGTAIVLSKIKDKLNGSVRFVFQPGEEETAGGKILVEKGALLNPKPNIALALHCWHGLPKGMFSSKPGALTSAADFFKIIVKGKGGHGAMPQQTIDPILTIAKIIDSLNHITSRKISALDSAVISVCHVESGKNTNIIPDTAMIEGTVRYFDIEVGKNIPVMIEQTVKGICDSMGATYEFIYKNPYIPMIIDEESYKFCKQTVTDICGTENWKMAKSPEMGAEDFAYFIKDNHGAMLKLGLGENYTPLHNPHFDFNDKVLKDGIMFFVAAVLKFLS